MKCIKKGTLPENRIWKGECHNCHSVYEALEGELVDIKGDHRNNHSTFAKAKCELCKYDFFLYPPLKSNAEDFYNK
jgi:hypothetical protein